MGVQNKQKYKQKGEEEIWKKEIKRLFTTSPNDVIIWPMQNKLRSLSLFILGNMPHLLFWIKSCGLTCNDYCLTCQISQNIWDSHDFMSLFGSCSQSLEQLLLAQEFLADFLVRLQLQLQLVIVGCRPHLPPTEASVLRLCISWEQLTQFPLFVQKGKANWSSPQEQLELSPAKAEGTIKQCSDH